MTIELQMLALSTALGLGQIVLRSHAANLQSGYRWSACARDQAMLPLTGGAAHLRTRVAQLHGNSPAVRRRGPSCQRHRPPQLDDGVGRATLLPGRVAYVPLYAIGVPLVRSIIWNVATIGIIFVLLGLV